jgi:hypothetical protein
MELKLFNIDINTLILIFLGILVLIAVITSLIKKKIQKKWIKKKVIIIGPKIIKDHFDSVIFKILASEDGTKEKYIYESTEYRSQKDDKWLMGEINGLEAEVLVNPKNPKKYNLRLNDVPPSQYS